MFRLEDKWLQNWILLQEGVSPFSTLPHYPLSFRTPLWSHRPPIFTHLLSPPSYIHSLSVHLRSHGCLLPATCPATIPLNEFRWRGNHWNEAHPSLARVIWFLLGGRLNQECQGTFRWGGNNGHSGRSLNVVFNTKSLQQWIQIVSRYQRNRE